MVQICFVWRCSNYAPGIKIGPTPLKDLFIKLSICKFILVNSIGPLWPSACMVCVGWVLFLVLFWGRWDILRAVVSELPFLIHFLEYTHCGDEKVAILNNLNPAISSLQLTYYVHIEVTVYSLLNAPSFFSVYLVIVLVTFRHIQFTLSIV